MMQLAQIASFGQLKVFSRFGKVTENVSVPHQKMNARLIANLYFMQLLTGQLICTQHQNLDACNLKQKNMRKQLDENELRQLPVPILELTLAQLAVDCEAVAPLVAQGICERLADDSAPVTVETILAFRTSAQVVDEMKTAMAEAVA